MSRRKLLESIKRKQSFLCVGLDTNPKRIPALLKAQPDPVFAFNKAIIDATAPYVVAFKPNTAFYEASGSRGWMSLEKTITYIKEQYPDILVIADAKRGDIGNTSASYARAFFDVMGVDAITVAPYMGYDSVSAFLAYKDKWTILLAATSNSGSSDFQHLAVESGEKVYELVVKKASQWAGPDQLMFVVGATKPSELAAIRRIVPDYFFLVPGVGAQGGNLTDVAQNAMIDQCGLIVNASRSIIYASDGEDFALAASAEAQIIQQEMAALLELRGLA
jgi:orotidine-5'-phosphate decarboxylase